MARFHKVVVELASTTGMPEDSVTNTFAVTSPDDWLPFAETGEITTQISNFYNSMGPSGFSIGQYLAPSVSRAAAAHRISIYDVSADLDGSPHGSPVVDDVFTLVPVAPVTALPTEVAMVLTLRVDAYEDLPVEVNDGPDAGSERDRPRSRGTGRLYIGPLGGNAVDVVANFSRPTTGLQTAAREAANALRDGLVAAGHNLCVWSRKSGVMLPVRYAQTDNAWDTQRSRGVAPTARLTTSLY